MKLEDALGEKEEKIKHNSANRQHSEHSDGDVVVGYTQDRTHGLREVKISVLKHRCSHETTVIGHESLQL
jgi:hypothetical protein